MKKQTKFKLAAFGSIMNIVLFIPTIILLFYKLSQPDNTLIKYLMVGVVILGLPFFIMQLYGYLMIAKNDKLDKLRKYTIIYMCFSVLAPIQTIFVIFGNAVVSLIIGMTWIVLSGIMYILYGLTIRRVIEDTFKFSRTIGLLYLIMGIIECTIIFAIVGVFFGIPLRMIEAKMFLGKSRDKK